VALSCNNATKIVNTTCTINADAANSDTSSRHLDILDNGSSDITYTPLAMRSDTSSSEDSGNSNAAHTIKLVASMPMLPTVATAINTLTP
jgi:hypothetical protein